MNIIEQARAFVQRSVGCIFCWSAMRDNQHTTSGGRADAYPLEVVGPNVQRQCSQANQQKEQPSRQAGCVPALGEV
jgi:hypothetical protein